MKCFVTGGAGFIGARISQKLLMNGHDVIVYDNLSVGKLENVPNGSIFIKGDILDYRKLVDSMQGSDIVFHQAAFVSIRNSFRELRHELEVNEIGTINVLDAMVETKAKKLVFASSMAVYGHVASGKFACEADVVQPVSPYGLSKLRGEMLCRIYSEQYGISYNVLRYFNVFGEGQQISDYVGVLTAFIGMARTGGPLTVYGDGMQERDFIFVDDVAEANLLSAKNLSNDVYNVGSGTRTTILSIARAVAAECQNVKISFIAKPPGEILTICADTTKAKKILGILSSRSIISYIPALCEKLNRRCP